MNDLKEKHSVFISKFFISFYNFKYKPLSYKTYSYFRSSNNHIYRPKMLSKLSRSSAAINRLAMASRTLTHMPKAYFGK